MTLPSPRVVSPPINVIPYSLAASKRPSENRSSQECSNTFNVKANVIHFALPPIAATSETLTATARYPISDASELTGK